MPATKQDAQQVIEYLFESKDRFESVNLLELEYEGESNGDHNFKATVEFESLEEFAETRRPYDISFSDVDQVRVYPQTMGTDHTDDTATITLRVRH